MDEVKGLRWLDDLYVTPAMEAKKSKIQWKINHGAGVLGAYLLVIPLESVNQLEIIPSGFLKQRYYRRKKMVIIGMTESMEEAYELVRGFLEETYAARGDGKIREWLQEKHGIA